MKGPQVVTIKFNKLIIFVPVLAVISKNLLSNSYVSLDEDRWHIAYECDEHEIHLPSRDLNSDLLADSWDEETLVSFAIGVEPYYQVSDQRHA